MNLLPRFFKRNLTGLVTRPDLKLEYSVSEITWSIYGGPKSAVIEVTGPQVDLWEMVEFLRCPVEIYTSNPEPENRPLLWGEKVPVVEPGRTIWWGYISEIEVRTPGVKLTISLESMANSIQVQYPEILEGGALGDSKFTSWYSAQDSIETYGTKQQRFRLSEGSEQEAQSFAQSLLNQLKYPVPRVEGGSYVPGARLYCLGWFSTLDWIFYQNYAGREEYTTPGTGLQIFGDATARTKVAQSIILESSTAWPVSSVQLRLSKVGNPTDNVVVQLAQNSGGVPGTVIATSTLSGSSLSTNLFWYTFTFSSPVTLQPAVSYWIVVSRSGSLDSSNYYKVDANDACGYTRGQFRIWNGSSWVSRTPDADMLFKFSGTMSTTDQILTAVSVAGQFFTSVLLDLQSSVYSVPYQSGSKTALDFILELMKSGSGGKEILAEVDQNRRLRLFSLPDMNPTQLYFLYSDGTLRNSLDQKIQPAYYKPGIWVKLKDVIPSSANMIRIGDPSLFFVEEVVYRDGKSFLISKNSPRILEVKG